MDAESFINLNDENNLSIEGMNHMDEEGDPVESTEKKKGKHRRHSRCWKHFAIVRENIGDGKSDVRCKHCEKHFFVNLNRSGQILCFVILKFVQKPLEVPLELVQESWI